MTSCWHVGSFHVLIFLSHRYAKSKCDTECYLWLVSCRYRCECEPGWTGKNCDLDRNDCLPSPCQNAGTCIDQLNGFTCKCRQGFRGERVNLEIIMQFSSRESGYSARKSCTARFWIWLHWETWEINSLILFFPVRACKLAEVYFDTWLFWRSISFDVIMY